MKLHLESTARKIPSFHLCGCFALAQEHHRLYLREDFCLEEMPQLAPLAMSGGSVQQSLRVHFYEVLCKGN